MNEKGAFLVETLIVIAMVAVVSVPAHLQLLRVWKRRLDRIQSQRLPYDGEISNTVWEWPKPKLDSGLGNVGRR